METTKAPPQQKEPRYEFVPRGEPWPLADQIIALIAATGFVGIVYGLIVNYTR